MNAFERTMDAFDGADVDAHGLFGGRETRCANGRARVDRAGDVTDEDAISRRAGVVGDAATRDGGRRAETVQGDGAGRTVRTRGGGGDE